MLWGQDPCRWSFVLHAMGVCTLATVQCVDVSCDVVCRQIRQQIKAHQSVGVKMLEDKGYKCLNMATVLQLCAQFLPNIK